MKKSIIILAALMVTVIGCQKKEDAGKTPVNPQAAAQATAPVQAGAPGVAAPQAVPQTAAKQNPAASPAGGDPHAAFKGRELPAGPNHKGKVLQVMDAGGYVYLEVEEKGQKLWVAALKATVNKNDTVEFPDSKPMENFESKSLKKTFDKIFFADALRVVK